MRRPRKTAADRRREWEAADARCWDRLRPKMQAVKTFVEAKLLAAETPGPNAPGRHYYSNLAFFLGTLIPPGAASYEEKEIYLAMIGRFALEPAAKEKAEQALREAMEKERPA